MQIHKLNQKLSSLCASSLWNTIGRPDLIHNLSSHHLSPTETEALSFGLKFATGLPKQNLVDTLTKNYRYTDTDFLKGYIQGIISASMKNHNNSHEHTLPKRHLDALQTLAHNEKLTITSSDKGGGVVIMDTTTYHSKIYDLLNDANTYTVTTLQHINKENTKFIKSYKKLISSQAKSWSSLIEYHPKIPTLYGLPKTHKPNIPMRPIISGIGSTPHKIAKSIAKLLTPLLGTISPSHLKNSGDLIQKLHNLNVENKLLASLDVKSLYTNIPVKKCLSLLKKHLTTTKTKLSLPTNILINICTLCTNLCFFSFNNTYYQQKFGLPMGSPLSGVLACIYLEFLEAGPFKRIIPSDATYYRYIDDALLIYPNHINISTLTNKLNSIERTIKFTHELEHNHTLPYLDILLHRSHNQLLLSVYRKDTNKNDLIHYYSHHNNKIKSGIIIGFFLRALRICSPQHLQEELNYITDTFTNLQYPYHFIRRARKKAYLIHLTKNNHTTKTPPNRYISLPTNQLSNMIANNLNDPTTPITTCTSTTIKNIITKPTKSSPQEACVYAIPCSTCPKIYIGETSRPIKKRLYEHKRALKIDDHSNALTTHRNAAGHNFDFPNTKVIKFVKQLDKRRCIESAAILQNDTIAQRPGCFNIFPHLAKLIMKQLHPPTKPKLPPNR